RSKPRGARRRAMRIATGVHFGIQEAREGKSALLCKDPGLLRSGIMRGQHREAHMHLGGVMKLDTQLGHRGLSAAADEARSYERMGFDGAWTFEAGHDPFLPVALAAQATERLALGTN